MVNVETTFDSKVLRSISIDQLDVSYDVKIARVTYPQSRMHPTIFPNFFYQNKMYVELPLILSYRVVHPLVPN